VREDWQNYRDQAREDWQSFAEDHYGWHGGWYGGYGSGYWGRWDYMWDNHPVAAALGVTWWGANAIAQTFGCGDYSNPYYAESSGGGYDYSEPVMTAPMEPTSSGAAPPSNVPPEVVSKFDQAREAFLQREYTKALALTDESLKQLPHDAVIHEFRSLVLFAMGRYQEAAAVINAVLAVGPGWDANTLIGLYPDMDTYTAQFRALEKARNENPKSADIHFLLGYHYLTCGYSDAALTEFRQAAELQPKDTVAASLVATLSPRDTKTQSAPAADKVPPAIPADKLAGTWTATKDTAKFTMKLEKDGKFTWGFTRGARKEEVKGVYVMEANVLAMEPDAGGVMLAELTLKGDNDLTFQMIAATKEAPLEFRRAQ
jgi:tetratricopeptide (TPR) repeat protein